MALHTHGFAHICPCTHVSLHTCPLRAILTRMPLHVCLCDTEGLTNSCSCTRMSPPPHTRVSSYTHTRVLAHACNSPGEKRTTESCSFPSDPPASGCCVSVSNTTHLWGTHTTGGGLGGPMGYGGRWGSYGLWGEGRSYGLWGEMGVLWVLGGVLWVLGGGVLWVMGGYGGHSLSFCDPPPPTSPSPSLTSRSAAPPPPPAPQGGNQRTARCPVCVWGGWGKRRGGGVMFIGGLGPPAPPQDPPIPPGPGSMPARAPARPTGTAAGRGHR